MIANKPDLTKIGVFYDGNYFLHVSNYYNYTHYRKRRISIAGLHNFIRHRISKNEGRGVNLCQIVDAHYFRSRLTAYEASKQGNTLYYDRIFDDILSSEGVTTHYLPIRTGINGQRYERNLDVWLALEAFEQAFYKRFDVVVLIAADGNYVPLIKKLNTLGTRVMLLSWDFDFTNDYGKTMATRTSQELLQEVTYPLTMHNLIDEGLLANQKLIENLFVPQNKERYFEEASKPVAYEEDIHVGVILSINNGFGFIRHPQFPQNLFFHYQSTIDVDFNDLRVNDTVSFELGENDRGEEVAVSVRLVHE